MKWDEIFQGVSVGKGPRRTLGPVNIKRSGDEREPAWRLGRSSWGEEWQRVVPQMPVLRADRQRERF